MKTSLTAPAVISATALKLSGSALVLSLALAGAASAQAQRPCITELQITAGEGTFRNAWDEPALKAQAENWGLVKVGYWDARGGSAGGDDGRTATGSDYITLSAKRESQDTNRCIVELKTVMRNDGSNLEMTPGWTLVGSWGVGQKSGAGGAVDTAGTFSTGTMWLMYRSMAPGVKPEKALYDVWIHQSAGSDVGVPGGYDLVGRWFGEGNTSVGSQAAQGVGCPGASCGSGLATLSTRALDFIAPLTGTVTSARLTGQWNLVGSCTGRNCTGLTKQIAVGASRELSNATVDTSSKSLTVTVGSEVKADTGMFPGGEVTASVEVSGSLTQELSREIAEAIGTTRDESFDVSCNGASSLWQWVSTLEINARNLPMESISIGSPDYVCAGPSQAPTNKSDYSWKDVVVPFVKCADEGAECTFPDENRQYDVRYGANGTWIVRDDLPSGFVCNNATFGRDPVPNVAKVCERR